MNAPKLKRGANVPECTTDSDYVQLSRDRYVRVSECIRSWRKKDWVPLYRLDEASGEYIPMICDKERERANKTLTVSEKCLQNETKAEK